MMFAWLLAVLDLGSLFAPKEAWTEKAEFFAVEHAKEEFVFASEDRTIVNCLKHDSCTWYGLEVWETKVYFDKSGDEEQIKRVEISLYNRGDAGTATLDVAGLKAKIAAVEKKLAPGEKKVQPAKTTLKNGSVQYVRPFAKATPAAELAWGLSAQNQDNARAVEYLRLTLMPKAVAKKGASPKRTVAGKLKVKENVTKSPNGDVYIDNVPMVDQGKKGYCAAAVSERVLRYYGHQIDEHEIAQQAGTTAKGGTSVDMIKEAVRAIGSKNGLGYQDVVSMTSSMDDIAEEVQRYNKAAKLEKKPELSLASVTRNHTVYVGELRDQMDPKVIYRMRQKDSRGKKFSAGIRQSVNAGIPVFWGVTLGIYPERGVNPQTTGGHMRLIIGYNDKKKELLYTDTWGEGHELKRMPEDWAFAITHDAFFLKP